MSISICRLVMASAAALTLASCGGGGDVAGGGGDMSLSPSDYSISIGEGSECGVASIAPPVVVTIVGGQPPFQIINSHPGALVVDRAVATGKNPMFLVSYSASATVCTNPGTITVLDYNSRVAVFTYNVKRD